jgi:hypothetical protein
LLILYIIISIDLEKFKVGIGKISEVAEWTDPENISRKLLSIEVEETEEMKQQRLELAQKESALKQDLKEITKVRFRFEFV